ncbi:hypothetical protein L6452_13703 [Arctium lappa]|uniref:Uncharacterized protein n=1 Tax=Arctium lappa TaxID=4217 RepID=A0ACB9CJA8_ARCLA|nr:hypothetical protein L6452_13703 [Arctium lappa]
MASIFKILIRGVADRRANRFVNRIGTEYRLRMEHSSAFIISPHILPSSFLLSSLSLPESSSLGFKILAFLPFIFRKFVPAFFLINCDPLS